MKITVKKTYFFDTMAERRRLNKAFNYKGEQLKRQLALLEAFEKRDWVKWMELFQALPRCPIHECSEKEFIGIEYYEFVWKRAFDKDLQIL
jgi:hypothetical protein